jgi:hypothetical protein
VRPLFQNFDGAIQTAQLVHQPVVFRLGAGPHSSLRERLNPIERLFSGFSYPADKSAVKRVDLQ